MLRVLSTAVAHVMSKNVKKKVCNREKAFYNIRTLLRGCWSDEIIDIGGSNFL